MSKLIICGQGHGIACVYEGLRQAGMEFVFSTADEALITRARKDGVKLVSRYLPEISSPQDIILTAAYKPKIPADHLARGRFINAHYALLPRYRGMHAVVWAMLNGDSHVGFSLHETSLLLDQGPILYQEKVEVADKTSWQLMEELDRRLRDCVASVVTKYRNDKIKPVVQNENDALFVAPRNREDCRIDWTAWDATFFKRALKALVPPYPRPFFEYKNVTAEIEDAEIVFRDYREIPGHVVYVDERSVWVKIPGGLLRVYKVVINGISTPAHEFIKVIGIRLAGQR